MSGIVRYPRAPSTIPTPSPVGAYIEFFGDGTESTTAGNLYKMDSSRVVTAVVSVDNEAIQDAIGLTLTNSPTVTLTYNDGAGTITGAVVTEGIQDLVGAFVTALDGTIATNYDDTGNTFTIGVGTITSAKVSDFTEAAQDAVGAMLTASSTIGVSYNDAGNVETLTVLDSPTVNGFTAANLRDRSTHTNTQLASTISDFSEAAQDAVGAILTDSSEIDGTYNDAGNLISLTLIDNTISRARLVNVAAGSRLLGRASGAAAGVVTDLTADQAMVMLNGDLAARAAVASVALTAVTTEQELARFPMPAGWNPPAGSVWEIGASGLATQTAVSVTGQFFLKVGATGVAVGSATKVAQDLTNTGAFVRTAAGWKVVAHLTIRTTGNPGTASGDIECSGQLMRASIASTADSPVHPNPGAAIGTTVAQDLILSWIWGAATLSGRSVDNTWLTRIA